MSQGTPPLRKPGAPTAPAAPAPTTPAQAARGPAKAGATGNQLVRITFSAPVFGMGEYSWTFICDGPQADAIQAAMLDRKPVKLTFPGNTVVLDTATIVLADFQPAPSEG